MAGYSSTPLPRKLGIKSGFRVAFLHAPSDFARTLGELPDDVRITTQARSESDLAVLFVTSAATLRREFPRLVPRIATDGMLWVAWPKKASGLQTDLTFDVVQRTGLGEGLVDTKICAIDDTWSGLRFVRRLEDRRRTTSARERGR
ncbi:MAG TPA: DUF3052 domain-containing protein [Gemmatimonadaceae bacterium]|nr:DUF3052 domain-containing protein [Gemmatimonadaceae bacterium]